MQCATCKSEISSTFKHAIAINECPACGGQIMDEETMALIEDVERTISSEVTLREGTAQKLAMAIVAKYDLSMRGDVEHVPAPSRIPVQPRQPKVAPPSAAQKVAKKKEDIVNISDLDEQDISEAEREEIMAEVIRKKFNMVDQATAVMVDDDVVGVEESPAAKPMSAEAKQMTGALFGGAGGVLEEERMLRLAKQQKALNSGGGSFRRSS